MNGNADCATNSSAATNSAGACDGDGNGSIGLPGAANQSGENYQFWRHLALAGLIEGTYTGMTGTGGQAHSILGTNVPRSKMNNMGWTMRPLLSYPGDALNFQYQYGQSMDFGRILGASGSTIGGGLKPEEAWNIDTKMDDGRPAAGKAVVYNRNVCTNSTSATDYASQYALSYQGTECGFYFANMF